MVLVGHHRAQQHPPQGGDRLDQGPQSRSHKYLCMSPLACGAHRGAASASLGPSLFLGALWEAVDKGIEADGQTDTRLLYTALAAVLRHAQAPESKCFSPHPPLPTGPGMGTPQGPGAPSTVPISFVRKAPRGRNHLTPSQTAWDVGAGNGQALLWGPGEAPLGAELFKRCFSQHLAFLQASCNNFFLL